MDGKLGGSLGAGGRRRIRRSARWTRWWTASSSSRAHEKAIKAGIASALLVGDGLLQVHVTEGAGQGRSRAVLPGAVQPDASLRLRRHRARLLRVQQPRERLPDLRRPGRRQADAPRAAGPRPAAEHPRRLLRSRGVQVQPGHLGRAGDVQPRDRAGFLARRAVERAARDGPRRRCCTASSRGRSRLAFPPEAKVRRDDWEGKEVGFDGIARRIERHYRRYRQRGEGSSRDGGVARQGDGRAHLPRLQRRAAPAPRGCCSRSTARRSTTSGSFTSTSCTRSSARSCPPGAAPTRAGRC